MATINIEFKINSKVYFVDMVEIPHITTCSICKGDKHFYSSKNNIEIKCPQCNGEGTTSDSGSLKYVVKSGILHKIVCTIDEHGNNVEYYLSLKSDFDIIEKHEIFNKEKDALKECEIKNKKGIMCYGKIN